jgi:hypothetical protein
MGLELDEMVEVEVETREEKIRRLAKAGYTLESEYRGGKTYTIEEVKEYLKSELRKKFGDDSRIK